jgi:hypothetical protein
MISFFIMIYYRINSYRTNNLISNDQSCCCALFLLFKQKSAKYIMSYYVFRTVIMFSRTVEKNLAKIFV